jgi:tetratricopeptide (TPR) repeat protein
MMTKAIVSVPGLLALVVSMLALASIPTHTAVAEGKPQETISPKVAKPMKAAQDLLLQKEYDQALVKIDEADAMQGKTAFDQYMINEFRFSAFVGQKKYAEAASVYEQNLTSDKVPPAEVNNRLKILVQLYSAVQNWPKTIDYGTRWVKAGNKDPEIQYDLAQAYYFTKDYRNSAPLLEGAIKMAEESGKAPDENWLKMLRSCYVELDDTAAAAKTLEHLVRYYPSPQYWELLLRSRLQQSNDDRVQVNLYRLAVYVHVLDSPDRIDEMAQMLLAAALPGEAESVMEAGYQAKAFETTDPARADRYSRRLSSAKTAAAKDRQSLPTYEKDAEKATTGQGYVALGMVYCGFGEYEKGATALTQGLQKGGVRDLDQARTMLGIAYLKLGKKAEAIKAFEQVTGDPKMADVAHLWIMVANSAAG